MIFDPNLGFPRNLCHESREQTLVRKDRDEDQSRTQGHAEGEGRDQQRRRAARVLVHRHMAIGDVRCSAPAARVAADQRLVEAQLPARASRS